MRIPRIIQGGPDLAIATWPLARAVAQAGELGVITGAVLPAVLARRLQMGDFDGSLRSVLESFPFPAAFRRVWEQFYVPGGKTGIQPFELVGQPHLEESPAVVELTVLANFAEVFLAKRDHAGLVGIHYHDSARLALLPSLYGALLAGVDFVLMGAATVATVLPAIQRLTVGQSAVLDVASADPSHALTCGFDPRSLGGGSGSGALRFPALLAICHSAADLDTVALPADLDGGFILAPPGASTWPDEATLARLRARGRPFWIGNVAGTPEHFARALAAGASGLQTNTPFTFCAESALDPDLKRRVLTLVRQDPNNLFTRLASLPDGRPFSLLRLEQTAADPETSAARVRLCDVGWFREVYRRPDGSVTYRCPGEPLHHYLLKGGQSELAARQPCICNGILASLGLAQLQDGRELERALIPAGEDIRELRRFLRPDGDDYTAAAVIAELTGPTDAARTSSTAPADHG